MEVIVHEITSPRKPGFLASASVEIKAPDGSSIHIHDLRVLKNKSGQVWCALPSYSIQQGGGQFKYEPAVELSRALQREVEDKVLTAYEAWAGQQAGGTR